MKEKPVELEEESFIRHKMFGTKKSPIRRYCELVVGEYSFWKLIKYEVITGLLGGFPGALGLALRQLTYGSLLGSMGRGVVIGRHVVLRHPEKIRLGQGVILDDYCLIDGRGSGDEGVTIGDRTMLGRGVMVQAKVGPIHIGEDGNIGSSCLIVSQGGVQIGNLVNLGGNCYISGGAYKTGREAGSKREHGKTTKGPIVIADKSRIGMCSIILDGVQIGEACIVGAGSLVLKDLPDYAVAAGSPASVRHLRDPEGE